MHFGDSAFILKTTLHKLPLSPKPGARKMEYKGNSWHETCFLCHRCQQPIGTKSFIPKDSGYFCVPCFEKQYAYQCCACKKVGCGVLHVTYETKTRQRKRKKRKEVHSCLFIISRPSPQEEWPIRRNPGIASVFCASAVGSNCQGSVSQPGKITLIASNASATSTPRNVSAAPSQSPVSRHVCLVFFVTYSDATARVSNTIRIWHRNDVSFKHLWCVQVLQGPSTSPLRSVSGTASVSPACSAPFPWWDEASSLSVTTSCALIAAGKSKNPTGAVRHQPTATTVDARFYFQHACHTPALKILKTDAFYSDFSLLLL